MREAVLVVENLYKAYADKVLFEDLSFGISKGQKIAFVAKNGAGKSTLLNIITKNDSPDSGDIVFRNDIRIGFLSQNPELPPDMSIKEYALKDVNPLEDWEYETKIYEILSKLRVEDYNQPISTLSGGEKKKLALSKVLAKEVDLMILDEPTNHLDVEMIEWLEDYLSRKSLSLFIVTHDRYFIDNVCNEIYELDNGQVYRYKGDYNYFIERKAEREHNERIEIEKARDLYKKELEWMRRMPKARTTKSKARIESFHDIKSVASKRIDQKSPEISIKSQRIGGKVLELHNISKAYEDKTILDNFSYTFKRGEKIGIVGGNGVGKTTLLNIISNKVKADMGKIIIGQTISMGYFTQEGIEEKPDTRVIDIIKDVAENIELDNNTQVSASQFLYYFGFSPELQYNYYSNLSGGERRRLYLLKTLMANPNFLILDEPTNDLDIYTLAMLENFLKEYRGCLLIVSHDRSFMDNLVDHLFVFEGDGVVRDYHSTYSDYLLERKAEEIVEKPKEEKTERVRTERKNKPTYKETREFESLSEEIPELEKEKTEMANKLSSGELEDIEELTQISERFAEIENILDEKEMRWLELSELFE